MSKLPRALFGEPDGESVVQPSDRLDGLRRAAEAFKAFRPAHEALTVVKAVPTRFVQFDHAVKVGGFPIERFALLHGRSGGGKTNFALGIIDSFLTGGHPALLIDAERTTPYDWAYKLLGDKAKVGFYAERPVSYEQTVKLVREFITTVKESRDAGILAPDASAIVVIDSIRKLVPEKMWDKLIEDVKKNGVDGMSGRAAQMKASLNSQWMDELTIMLAETGTCCMAIARETEDPNASIWDRKAGRDYKVGGGAALYYDSSLVLRVDRAGFVQEGQSEEGKAAKVYGERHMVTIRKTKVAGQEERQTSGYFHTSNGTFIPYGFDRARDVLELAVKFGVVTRSGSWFGYDDGKIGQGINQAVSTLTGSPEWLAEIEQKVRSRFQINEPALADDDGVME